MIIKILKWYERQDRFTKFLVIAFIVALFVGAFGGAIHRGTNATTDEEVLVNVDTTASEALSQH